MFADVTDVADPVVAAVAVGMITCLFFLLVCFACNLVIFVLLFLA